MRHAEPELRHDRRSVVVSTYLEPPLQPTAVVGPGTERDQCLSFSAGAGAATECGDLRLVVPLPEVQSLGRTRAPTLLYNSQFAHPYPTVQVPVTVPTGLPLPTTVKATLLVNGTARDSGTWNGSDWGAAGNTRQISLGYDAVSDSTNVYGYTIQVVGITAGVQTTIATDSGQLAVVNRSQSPFGAGWWLAGLDQLIAQPDGAFLFVGGDGSARVYTPVPGQPTEWTAPQVDHRDLLHLVSGEYVQVLPHGLTVHFNAAGRHTSTVNRLGHITTFTYDTTCNQLSRITTPVGSLAYTVAYTTFGAPPCGDRRLATVTAPPIGSVARVVTLSPLSNGQVSQVRDLDSSVVQFGYDSTWSTRITSRTNELGKVVSFAYDAGGKLRQVSHAMDSAAAIVTTYTDAATLGFQGSAAVDTAQVYTLVNGPRTDTTITKFWLDRFGAPRKIADALGQNTTLTRGDARWPALATRLVAANGLVTTAGYDDHGNLLADTAWNPLGDSQNAVSSYTWDRKWDFVTSVRMPSGLRDTLQYDPSDGNRAWEQDDRGIASRVNYSYEAMGAAAGLIASVKPPLAAATTFGYDTLGNLCSVTTPRGFTTASYKDAVGRDTLVRSPVDTLQTTFRMIRTQYDILGRVRSTSSFASGVSDTLVVTNSYDPSGELTSVARRSSPDTVHIGTITTAWRYDAGGRKVAEIAPDGSVDSTVYDPAGNAIELRTRRGYLVVMQYDVLNRLSQRITPDVAKLDTTAVTSDTTWHFPLHALPSFGDTASFSYDAMGRTLTANNHDAHVTRSYLPGGAIATDSLWIRTYAELSAGGDFTTHAYGLAFGYDLDGRRKWMKHPHQLGAHYGAHPTAIYDSTAYQYEPGTGRLTSATDIFGNAFANTYDYDGNLTRVLLPGGHFKRFVYDADGEPSVAEYDSTGGNYYQNTLVYNAAGEPSQIKAPLDIDYDAQNLTYGAHGAVATSQKFGPGSYTSRDDQETFVQDALANLARSYYTYTYDYYFDDGNVMEMGGTTTKANTFADSSGRLTSSLDYTSWGGKPMVEGFCSDGAVDQRGIDSVTHAYLYDASGDQYWSAAYQRDTTSDGCTFRNATQAEARSASYYDALGHLRAIDRRRRTDEVNQLLDAPNVFEEYRYDALGRRVLRRDRNSEAIQRYIWDGDEIADEIFAPGGDAATTAQLERDTASAAGASDPSGRVIYLQGEQIDKPLSITRIGYADSVGTAFVHWDPLSIVVHWDYRGMGYDHTSYGPTSSCDTVGTVSTCITLIWAASRVNVDQPLAGGSSQGTPQAMWGPWFGSLPLDQQDASGALYMRNRYYDPASARFTQEDPLGLAGGFNAYGYANGDPISYSDPFGLCPGLNSSASIFDCPPGYFEIMGAIVGGIGGFFGGGGAGVAVAAPTAEVGSVVTVPVGAVAGAIEGAKAGAVAGALADGVVQMARAGKGRGGNRVPNSQVKRLYKQYGLNEAGQDYVHEIITDEGMTNEEIEDVVKEAATHDKFLTHPPPSPQ